MAPRFADLIKPFDVPSFIQGPFGKQWTHIKGDPIQAAAVFSWNDLNRILAQDVWNSQTMSFVLDGQRAPPQAFCRQTVNRAKVSGMYPDQAKVKGLLRQGASMVLNDIATLTPAICQIVDELQTIFNGRADANLYYSQKERQAFKSHYDRHEVFALQIFGQKKWRIYKGQAEAPIEHPRFYNIPQATYDQMKGPVDKEIVMAPGDLLYLPRGQFHDALAMSGHSLHITFSCAVPMGLNLVEDMVQRLIDEGLFRADLPRPDDAAGEAALRARLDAMVARIGEIYGGDNGVALAKQVMANFGQPRTVDYKMPDLK